jgi:hypothetical protein
MKRLILGLVALCVTISAQCLNPTTATAVNGNTVTITLTCQPVIVIPPTCIPPQVLVNGVCADPLPPTCTAPEVLVNGACVCQPPNTRVNGVCLPPVDPGDPPPPYTIPSGAIEIKPGSNVQSIISGAAEGATFVMRAGTYRIGGIAPRNNQTILAETPGSVILNGSRLVTPTAEGPYWVVTGQTQQGQVHGECDSGHPRCAYPEDLFVDDVPQLHVASISAVGPGKWFFDYNADKVYMGSNPAGHRVEISVYRNAIFSGATGVTVRGIVAEKYASPAQMGAIGDQFPSSNWTVTDSEFRLNHGVGLMATGGWKVQRNKFHHNGQLGVRAEFGSNILIEGNEIYANAGWAGFNAGWEAGAAKFLHTDGLTVRNNNSHHNNGIGLWTDLDNIRTVYEGNTVAWNDSFGILHEISYDAKIRNNVVQNNGHPACFDQGMFCAQIGLYSSQNVEISGNTVGSVAGTSPKGIGVINQTRGAGQYGTYAAKNNYVHDNAISISNTQARARNGVQDDTGSAVGNAFNANHYHLPSTSGNDFLWRLNGSQVWGMTWTAFRLLVGQESSGTIDTTFPVVSASTQVVTAGVRGSRPAIRLAGAADEAPVVPAQFATVPWDSEWQSMTIAQVLTLRSDLEAVGLQPADISAFEMGDIGPRTNLKYSLQELIDGGFPYDVPAWFLIEFADQPPFSGWHNAALVRRMLDNDGAQRLREDIYGQ